MALHLNLYHEIQKTKALKRRDPLKISMWILGSIAALFALYYFIQLLNYHGVAEELDKVKTQNDKIAPLAKAAKRREDVLTIRKKASDALGDRIENRFYWAPILEQFIKTVPRNVQITRLNGDVPPDGLRRCTIVLDGIAAGTDARKVAEDLRTAIAEAFSPKYKGVTSTFKTLEDGVEPVVFDGKPVPTATFTIAVQIPLIDEKSLATPPPRKRR